MKKKPKKLVAKFQTIPDSQETRVFIGKQLVGHFIFLPEPLIYENEKFYFTFEFFPTRQTGFMKGVENVIPVFEYHWHLHRINSIL